MENKKLIVVLGMHRSGTSAITRALTVMGVALGEKMMPSVEGVNSKGFWEDLDINNLNIEMLTAVGSDWNFLIPIDDNAVDVLVANGFFERAVELLQSKMHDHPVFGFKDPRVAKLMPFWRKVFAHCGLDVTYVLAIRNPLSVAQSLVKRDEIVRLHSFWLWLEHVFNSLIHSEGQKRVVVDYDLLMQAPDHELNRLAERINLSVDQTRLVDYKNNFLDNALRHASFQLKDLELDSSCPAIVKIVYADLFKIASDELDIEGQEFKNKVALISGEMEKNFASFSMVDGAHKKLAKTKKEFESKIEKLNETIRYKSEQIRVNKDEIDAKNAAIKRNDSTIEKNETQINHYKGELANEIFRFNGIIQSTSWKITWPLREMKRWISQPAMQAKRYAKLIALAVKKMYLAVPISLATRVKIRNQFLRYAPDSLKPTLIGNYQRMLATTTTVGTPYSKFDLDATPIEIKSDLTPLVSIVIPIYGKVNYTLRCLASIARNLPAVPFEIIVVDDCSPDDSAKLLQRVGGIHVISNVENQGFIRSCNIGARAAKGRYVCFLNNDTEVAPDWLDALVATFDDFPGTGFVGSKLIYPDGSLQEAGGIIWRDGSAWNFGRHQDQLNPVFNYAREVDYCSGASVAVPKDLFEQLGGFDEHYLPAYCEDSDLALKIRDLGYRVIYQPLSVVVHYEGITSGTDTSGGVKAYQIANAKKLFARWEERLKTHQPNGENVDSAKDRMLKRRVLVIDHCTPTPDQDAGSGAAFNLMMLLREMDFQITFIPEDNFFYDPEYTTTLQRNGVEALYSPYLTSVEQHLKECDNRYDLVFMFRPLVVANHLKLVRKYCTRAKVLFHTQDLHYVRMTREAGLLNDPKLQKAADQMKEIEFDALRDVDASIVVSESELHTLNKELPAQKIFVFPLILDVPGSGNNFSERRDIVFVGGYQHTPNIDAVLFFAQEVMPLLREKIPGIRLHLVGSKATEQILDLACDDILIAGFIQNLNAFLNTMRLSVAPLRYGAGVKGKIGTSLAAGLPVVGTTVAVEGMSLTNNANVVVADTPEEFVDEIRRVYLDESLWETLSKNGVEFADNAWGPEAAFSILKNIIENLGFEIERGNRALSLWRN